MIRRLFVWCNVLLLLGLIICPQVWAQCGANPCYTINPPVYVYLTPAQAAAQGAVTITMNVSYTDSTGVEYAHNVTLGSGTVLQVNYTTNNASRVDLYYSSNGGSRVLWQSNVALTGSFPWNFSGQQTLQLFAVANSGVSTDIDTLTITNQAPGVYGSDKHSSNSYAQINTSGGGGSMAADFVECQAGQIHQCINATHTPFTQVLVTNTATGDSLFHSKHVAGNVAKYNEQVSYGDSLCCISVQEDSILQFREDDEVDCSVAGPVPPAPKHKDVQFGMKITYSWVSALVKSNGWHPEAAYCSDASSPPDWPGPFEASPNTKSGEYAAAEEMYREVDAGKSFTGVPWSWWFSYITEPYIYPSDPYPPNCTNTDKGFKNGVNVFWPLPGLPF